MNSFKEKFKIAKILASLFTHSSTPEEEKNYRAWLNNKMRAAYFRLFFHEKTVPD